LVISPSTFPSPFSFPSLSFLPWRSFIPRDICLSASGVVGFFGPKFCVCF
jgi:hypothetical protein